MEEIDMDMENMDMDMNNDIVISDSNKKKKSFLDPIVLSKCLFLRSKKGDTLLFIEKDGTMKLFEVLKKESKQGRKGSTILTLRNIVEDYIVSIDAKDISTLVLRVIKPVNARTLRKFNVC
jgi:hypothetical protein